VRREKEQPKEPTFWFIADWLMDSAITKDQEGFAYAEEQTLWIGEQTSRIFFKIIAFSPLLLLLHTKKSS